MEIFTVADLNNDSKLDFVTANGYGSYIVTVLLNQTAQPISLDLNKNNIPDECDCTVVKIYGEYSEETELLRYFRDKILCKTPAGLEIIRLYYKWSPAIVEAMEEDAAIFSGLMLKVKQSFGKAKDEALSASYDLWEKYDQERPSVEKKVTETGQRL